MISAVGCDLPTGTVTFCFTDVEGSTALVKRLGAERYAEVLTEHRRLLREAFGTHDGVEVDTQGDAFFYAFADARRAVAACTEVQRALAAGPVRVRIGLHTGTPHLTPEGYVGEDLHLGARVGASGHGGQVLLSAATRELVRVDCADLGQHRLKDFVEPIRIFQLGRERFPPLRTISNTNLPRPASLLVGRTRETQEVASLLSGSVRFLTLTGPGGTGKTRLAIEAASELVPSFTGGVFWVGLATLQDAALVTETIAESLGARDGLQEFIGARELLLVVDNLEQVVDEAAPELGSLVERCPNLKLLVTSRELLRVRGEVEYAVPPLSDGEAVTLFCHRAQLEPDATIASLCRRLDNLPLALELAAARTSVLSPKQIVERLSKRLDLLRGGRDIDPRQQTLRATIEWSHELLSPDERQLFGRLSVFAGGCTLDAAEAVAEADLDVLQALVDKSLVRHGDERFWMLNTIRQYAAERLEMSGESDRLRQSHADYFLAVAEEAEPWILGLSPQQWLDRLQIEHDNLRVALEWLEAAGKTQQALALSGAIWEFWCLRGHYAEGWRRLEHLLHLDERASPARAKALTGAAHLAGNAGANQAGDLRAEQALALHSELGDPWGIAYSQWQLSAALARRGELADAVPLAEASARTLSQLGDEHHALQATEQLGWCRLRLGEIGSAKSVYEELLNSARDVGDTQMQARALVRFAVWASEDRRHGEALALLREVYRLDTELGDPNEIVMDIIWAGWALAAAGRAEPAVMLLAGAEAMREELGFPFPADIVQIRDEAYANARAYLDETAFADACERGRVLTRDGTAAALDAILEELGVNPPSPSRQAS